MAKGGLEGYENFGHIQLKMDDDIETPKEIPCPKCKQFSGYLSSKLYCLKKGRELKCKECGETVLKHL
jgi:hypothetical protein